MIGNLDKRLYWPNYNQCNCFVERKYSSCKDCHPFRSRPNRPARDRSWTVWEDCHKSRLRLNWGIGHGLTPRREQRKRRKEENGTLFAWLDITPTLNFKDCKDFKDLHRRPHNL